MARGEPGRNDPCPCGSGKKYKKCHLGAPMTTPLNVSLDERNTIFVDAVADIFELRRGTWGEVKRRITPERVRELYKAQQFIWAAPIATLLPGKTTALTSLFLGRADPEDLAQHIFRFGLYTDRILVINPFTFPTLPGRHPVDDPDSYVRDTLKLVYVIARVEPWIRAGLVALIGDPMAYDPRFHAAAMDGADRRAKELGGIDERDLAEAQRRAPLEMRRILASMPRSSLEAYVRKNHPDWKDAKRAALVDEMTKANEADPLGLIPFAEGAKPPREMVIERRGTSLESALAICDATGAFPYADSATKWRELLSAMESLPEVAQTWSPLTKAFQGLEFQFLNNVDAAFAKRLREEGRLLGFRQFLQDLWKKIGGSPDPSRAESLAREFAERLIEEHRRAEEDWKKIDRDTAAAGAPTMAGLVSTAASVLSGALDLRAGLFTCLIPAIAGLAFVGRATAKRNEFRVSTPMSVFVDLARHRGGPS